MTSDSARADIAGILRDLDEHIRRQEAASAEFVDSFRALTSEAGGVPATARHLELAMARLGQASRRDLERVGTSITSDLVAAFERAISALARESDESVERHVGRARGAIVGELAREGSAAASRSKATLQSLSEVRSELASLRVSHEQAAESLNQRLDDMERRVAAGLEDLRAQSRGAVVGLADALEALAMPVGFLGRKRASREMALTQALRQMRAAFGERE